MQGGLVVVRDFAGNPRLARVYSDRGAVVDVCSALPGKAIGDDGKPLPPIGVRRDDVFRYTEELLRTGNWDAARPL